MRFVFYKITKKCKYIFNHSKTLTYENPIIWKIQNTKRASKKFVWFNEKNIQETKMKIKSVKLMYSFKSSYVNLHMISAICQNSVCPFLLLPIKLTSFHPWAHLPDSKSKVSLFVTTSIIIFYWFDYFFIVLLTFM